MADADWGIDRRVVRRRFDRAAGSYAGASRLEAEIGSRMLERLQLFRLSPGRVLDAGCGPGREASALLACFAGARLIALDVSLAMLRRARASRGLLSRLLPGAPQSAVCASLEALPLADASIGLVWSNMALHWLSEPIIAFREFHRVLRAEGLVMFSTLGPDTLKELRVAAGADRTHRFLDMHDLGDRLVAAGFSAPVMDMEIVTMTFADPEVFLADLRASGQTAAASARPRGLAGRTFREQLRQGLRAQMRDGRLPATYEVVYGHAWKPVPRAHGGTSVVRLERAAHKKN